MKVTVTVEIPDGALCNHPYPDCPFLKNDTDYSHIDRPFFVCTRFNEKQLKHEGHNEVLKCEECFGEVLDQTVEKIDKMIDAQIEEDQMK